MKLMDIFDPSSMPTHSITSGMKATAGMQWIRAERPDQQPQRQRDLRQ